MEFDIQIPDRGKLKEIRTEIDQKIKPTGALGRLEAVAERISLIQQTLQPEINHPLILVFAGDHGIVEEGVSSYPAEVTRQMVRNFLDGGAAINAFARLHEADLFVVDAGVRGAPLEDAKLINAKMAEGTHNFLRGAAMSETACRNALEKGAEITEQMHRRTGTNLIGFGEMGIGNTSPSALLMHRLTGEPLEKCIGRGAGLGDEQLSHKQSILQKANKKGPQTSDPVKLLAHFGGFEIAMLTGAYLQAASLGLPILVDGFIATCALLVAHAINPDVLEYCIFSHVSDERGHRLMLEHLDASPLLQLNLRLGEGTGAALALPIVRSAVAFMNEMETFDSTNVEDRRHE